MRTMDVPALSWVVPHSLHVLEVQSSQQMATFAPRGELGFVNDPLSEANERHTI